MMLNPDLDATGRRRVIITAVAILLLIVTFVGLFFWKMTYPRALTRAELSANGLVVFDVPRRFEDFEFVDHRGQPFRKDDLIGKWTMIFPGFTHCPDICPVTMSQLAQMWDMLDERTRKDLQVVMLSVDPHRDTPEQLGQYVPFFNENFIGLTTDIETLTRVGAQLSIAFTVIDPEAIEDFYTVDHSGNIVLINPAGHYHGFFRPPFDPARLRLTYQSACVTY